MPHAALNELVALAGLPAADAQIVGDDPVIPTQYRVGAAGAAALALPPPIDCIFAIALRVVSSMYSMFF